MSPAAQLALDEALKWSVLGSLGLTASWVTVKRTAIRNWRREREARHKSMDQMLASWPTFMQQVQQANDSAGRNTEQFTALHSSIAGISRDVADLLALNYGQFEHNPAATFVCDNAGRNMLVNSAYARLLQTGRDELMDYGYRRFIAPREVAGYLERFKVAADEHREFECNVCLVRADGSEVKVHIRMVPHPRQKGPATHWIGTIGQIEGQC